MKSRAELIGRCVSRAADITTPEQRLFLAVVLTAIQDAYNARTLTQDRHSAIAFLRSSRRLGTWTWACGIDPEYVQHLIDELHDHYYEVARTRR